MAHVSGAARDHAATTQPSISTSLSPTERSPLLFPAQDTRHVFREGAVSEHDTSTSNPRHARESPSQKANWGHTAANQSIGRLRGFLVASALGFLTFIQATNISMLTTMQSAIAEDLDTYEAVTYFTTVYLIAMSALGPVNGKLCNIFSPRSCIVVASVLMAVGVLICGSAKSFEVFLLGRIVTGIGASGIFTISIIITLELSGSERKGLAIGILNSALTFGVAIGATVAGALVDVVGWRTLFYLQSPIAVLGGLILLFAIPHDLTSGSGTESDSEKSTWKQLSEIDHLGAVTLTTSLVLLLYSLSAPGSIPIWPIVLSITVGAVFIVVEAHWALDPIIPISLLKSRGMLLSCLATVGFMMARWSVLFYTPTYAIAVRQWSASTGGALLIPTNGGFAAGGLLVGWLHIKRPGSFYLPTLISYAALPVTLMLLAAMAHQEGSPAAFVAVLTICGFATGAALNYSLAHLLHLTPKATHYVASALLATFRGFAGSFGTAIGGGLFTRTLSDSLKDNFAEHGLKRDALVRQLLGSPALVGRLSGVERDVAIKAYGDSLRTLWFAAAVLAAATVVVQAGVGFRGHEEKLAPDEGRRESLHEEDVVR